MFLPVTGPDGAGEYIRSLTIAQGAQERWPGARIRFVMSRAAPYTADVPFETHVINGTPTEDPSAVDRLFRNDPPDVAVFDNAGRTAQMQEARRLGIRVVYISRRPKLRWKAFRLRWLRSIRQHWIAFPAFIEGELTPWERTKLRWVGPQVEVVFLGAVYRESTPEGRRATRRELQLDERPYVLFAPGGGGIKQGQGTKAPQVFAQAAQRVVAATDSSAIVVTGPAFQGETATVPGVKVLRAVSNARMIDLIHDASLVAVNGGTTLTQALAHRRVCVAAAVANDQPRRVRRCHELGLLEQSPLEAIPIGDAIVALLQDPERQEAIRRRVEQIGLTNGLPRAVEALNRLVREAGPRPETLHPAV